MIGKTNAQADQAQEPPDQRSSIQLSTRKQVTPMAPEERALDATRPPLSQARVLVADDLKLSQTLLVTLLRQQHVTDIETADDGRSALQRFVNQRFDAVFLDIDMPLLDGFGVLTELKALDPSAFVCLVSGTSTVANLVRAKELGVDAFLAKPISGARLAAILAMYSNGVRPQ